MQVALIQGKSQGTIQANLDYYSAMIRKAVKPGTSLVVLPELMFTNYFPIIESTHNFNLALNIDSAEIKAFAQLAKELKIILTVPFYEKRSEGVYHNSMLVFEKDGSLNAHYRKMHIPDDPGFYEKYYFIPGDKGFVVAKTSVAKLGLLICWDQWFPEAARINALKGAQVLLYPTAIGWDTKELGSEDFNSDLALSQLEAWMISMRAHAIANGVYVIAVNRVGREGHLQFWGNSFCVDPFGKIVAQAGIEEEIIHVELDLAQCSEARHVWPFLRDRRVDQYQDLQKILAD